MAVTVTHYVPGSTMTTETTHDTAENFQIVEQGHLFMTKESPTPGGQSLIAVYQPGTWVGAVVDRDE